jgi:hypothetical protein
VTLARWPRVARATAAWPRPAWPLAFLGGAGAIWFGGWLISPIPRMGGDVLTEFYPWLAYATAEIRGGVLPLWGPFSLAGTPLLANPQVGILYPLNWPLLAVLPVDRALNWSAALHVAFAAVATYGLGRRWGLSTAAAALAASCYALNGFVAARLWAGNLNLVQVATWLPALLLVADLVRERLHWRAVAALAAALLLALLVGFYQLWFLGVLTVVGYLAIMPGSLRARVQRLTACALAGVIALGLAAPQLVPAAELVQWSTRGDRLDWEFVADASLPPWHLPSLALPELFGNGAGTYWAGVWWHWHELTAYAGLLPLVLVVLALRRPRTAWVWYCVAVAALALVLALGRYTPVYGWAYQWVPGYGSFRDPGRHLVLVSLMLALLAGRGADRLLAGRGRGGVLAALFAVLLGGAGLAAGAAAGADVLAPAVVPTLTGWGIWPPRDELLAHSESALGELVLLLAARAGGLAVVAAALALVAVFLARRLAAHVGGALLVLAVLADLTLFGWRFLDTPQPLAEHVAFDAPAAQYRSFLGAAAVARLQQAPGLWRTAILGRDGVVAGNAGYVLGVPLAIGLDPLLPRRYAALAARVDERPVQAFQNVALFLESTASPLWPLLNARYRLEVAPGPSPPQYVLSETADALARAFAVADVRLVGSEDEALAVLANPLFDPRVTAVLQVGSPAPVASATEVPGSAAEPSPTAVAGADVREYRPGHLSIHATLPAAGALVVLEAWHPGWTATVDGAPAPVYPADEAFLGLRLPAGEHEVRLDFAPGTWTVGLAIAAATAALSLLGVLAAMLRERRGRQRERSGGGEGQTS